MGLGPLKEQSLQLMLLRGGQAGRWPGMGLRRKTIGVFGQLKPAVDGTRVDADDTSDILDTVARLDGPNGLTSSLFQSAS